MSSKLTENPNDINKALAELDSAYKYLEEANSSIKDPNLKRRLSDIKKRVLLLQDQITDTELKYRQSLEDKEAKKRLVEDERYRTNYNHNTDGRINGAYYSGQGDMGKWK